MMFSFEKALWKEGFKKVAGCDEVGRGPLAGPLVAAAVVLPEDCDIEGLNDSKQLSEQRRNELYDAITEVSDYAVVSIPAREVDALNVYRASRKAMETALSKLSDGYDYVLSDAMELSLSVPSQALIKGDQKSATIAAASILAKVHRDRYMTALGEKHPGFGFERHKGYPTKAHLEALEKLGAIDEHRRSFAPVKKTLERQLRWSLEES